MIEALRNIREETSLNRFVSTRELGKTEYLKISPSAQKAYDDNLERIKRQNKKSSHNLD